MSYEKKFVKKILESKNIFITHITRASESGQKKVFFITIDGKEYVFKMINVTPIELENDLGDIDYGELDNIEDEKIIIDEKVLRIKNELKMAKGVPILPQLKILDDYNIYKDEDECYLYYIEEKFEGETLTNLYNNCVFSLDETIDFIYQLVKIVEIMYNMKYIHRDIKPGNIIVNKGKYLLIDGGLCKHLDDDLELTRTPDFVGTYRWAAPEQEKRDSNYNWDFTTDLYAIGLISIELYLKEARQYSEKHLKDLEYIYSKWNQKNKKSKLLFSKIIYRLCSTNKARRFNNFEEIYKILDEIKMEGSEQ